MPIFVECCSKFLNICVILRIVYSLIEEYNRPIRRDYMSVIKRLLSLFLLVLTLLLLQHAISCRIRDNYNSKVTSQSYRSANYAYQRLHLHSVAKTVVKKSVPAQDYLSTILLASVLLIAHLKFDFANIFFAITHIPVYLWQLARCDLSKTPVYRTKDEI